MSNGILTSCKVQWARKQAERRAKAHSDEIDFQIQEDSKNFRRVCIVLLLGHTDHDICSIVRQMKIIHQNGYTHEERMEFRLTIWKNLLETARRVVRILQYNAILDFWTFRVPSKARSETSEENWECIMNHPTPTDGVEFSFKPELANAVRGIWTDDITPVSLHSPSRFSSSLLDDAAYFFSETRRITSTDYIPSNEDILRTPAMIDAGITETDFKMGQLSIRLCHISGQLKKWIHQFECVSSIIFCAPLADYDQVSEDGRNLLGESLVRFESVVNSRWFLHAKINLLFTGIDQFKAKLPKVPLDRYFPEYTGGADVNKATKYVLWRFMQVNRAQLNVYPQDQHYTGHRHIEHSAGLHYYTRNDPSTSAQREQYRMSGPVCGVPSARPRL